MNRVNRSQFLRIALLAATGILSTGLSAGPRKDMLVSTAWLQSRLKDPSLALLHIARDRADYKAGHIPGACFVPFAELAVTRDGVSNELPPATDLVKLFERCGVSDNSRIVLYGDSTLLSATRAYFTLDYLGHGGHAALLDGGFEKWRAEKRPISAEEPAPRQGRFGPRLRPEVVVKLDQMRDLSWTAANVPSSNVFILDARAEASYKLAGPNTGHIPGAVNVFWAGALASKEVPVMKPRAEVARMYKQAGAPGRGRTIVAYCNSGVQATHAYFTLKYLGYDDVRLYDGSFSEWTRAKAPVQ